MVPEWTLTALLWGREGVIGGIGDRYDDWLVYGGLCWGGYRDITGQAL